MDHREQMQKDAENWQKTSVKILQWVRYGVLLFAALGLLVLLLQNVNKPRTIEETLAAVVFTQSGEEIPCTVTLKGQISEYLFNKEKYGRDDSLILYVDGVRLMDTSCGVDRVTGTIRGEKRGTMYVMSADRMWILLETDAGNIFEGMEGGRCILAAPATDREHLLTVMDRLQVPEVFDWIR